MTERDRRHERLIYWAHAWQRYARRLTTLGPLARLPAVDRRILAAMRRCRDYGVG